MKSFYLGEIKEKKKIKKKIFFESSIWLIWIWSPKEAYTKINGTLWYMIHSVMMFLKM